MQQVTLLQSFTSNAIKSFPINSQALSQYLQFLFRAKLFLGYSFARFRLSPFQSPIPLVPPKLPFPIIIFAIDYFILSSYPADLTPISYSAATVRDLTIGAEDVTDMTSSCRKRTEVIFDTSLTTQITIIQNTRNQRKLIYVI